MMWCFLGFLILILIYKYDYIGHKHNKAIWFVVVYIILILVAGLRYRIGVDTIRYENKFSYVPMFPNLDFEYLFDNGEKLEPLSALLFSISKTIFDGFYGVQLLQAAIVCILMAKFIRKHTHNIFTATFLFFICLYLNFTCEVMREACAVSFFLLAWDGFKERKWLKYYFFVCMAIGFHYSAIILLILPIFRMLNLDKILDHNISILLFISICVLAGIILQNSFFDYIQLININENINNRVMSYDDSVLSGGRLNIYGLVSNIPKYVIYPLGAILILRKRKIPYYRDICLMSLFAIGFSVLTLWVSLFYRYNNYFMPFVIIAISSISFYKKQSLIGYKIRKHTFLNWAIMMIPFVFMYIYSYMANVGDTRYKQYSIYCPYKSVIFEEKDYDREQIFNYYGTN